MAKTQPATTIFISFSRSTDDEYEVAATAINNPLTGPSLGGGAAFEPTLDGMRALGRYLANHWPEREDYYCSDINNPRELGIDLDPDQIRAAIAEGESEFRVGEQARALVLAAADLLSHGGLDEATKARLIAAVEAINGTFHLGIENA